MKPESNYESSRKVRGQGALDEICTRSATFLVGADQCGKSAMSKMLMYRFRERGEVPLRLQGEKIPADPLKFKGLIASEVELQYGIDQSERFFNLPLTERVLIIDDYQFVDRRVREKHAILDMAKRFSGRVVIFGHETEIGPTDLTYFALSEGPKVSVMFITPLPFKRTALLIRKWLEISPSFGDDNAVDQRKESDCQKMVNAVIGDYMQPFPPYVLAILQSVEAGKDVDISVSTHGYLYEIFIKSSLAKRSSSTNYNVISAFIATLAIDCFEREQAVFGKEFIKRSYLRFERETDLERDSEKLIKDLVDLKILRCTGEEYEFRENYIFYYFVAFYLKDRISEDYVRSIIVECSDKAWVKDYSNVLLFLAHLSKDRFIVDTLLRSAEKTFEDIEPARLEGEIYFLAGAEDPLLVLDEDREQSAEAKLREQEILAQEGKLVHTPYALKRDSSPEEVGLIGNFSAAIKRLQVLGQMLKNFPANFDPEMKVKLVNECIDLGLRSLGKYFEFAENGQTEILKEFAILIKARDIALSDQEALERANLAVSNLCHLSTLGVVKRISYAIGSSELGKTYAKVFNDEQSVARKLVNVSLNLDRAGSFPEESVITLGKEWAKERFALRILRSLVVRNFRLFHRSFSIRQRVSDKIGISYTNTVKEGNEGKVTKRK